MTSPLITPEIITHTIVSPYGSDHFQQMGDFSWQGEVPGGWKSAACTVELDRVKDQRDIYTFGATWVANLASDNTPVFGGYLLRPGRSQGKAQLSGRGWGVYADRAADFINYQDQAYSSFSAASGDPFGYATDEGSISVSADGGQLLFKVSDGSNISTNDRNSLASWYPGNSIRRVAGHIVIPFTTANWQMRVLTSLGPNGARTVRYTQSLNGATAIDFDQSFDPGDDDIVLFELFRNGAADPSTPHFWMKITNMRVNSVAPDDEFTTTQIIRDICGRVGVNTAFVNPDGVAGLPLVVRSGNFQDPLDYACLLNDWRWTFISAPYIGTTPNCDAGPWTKRVWYVEDPEQLPDLQPLEQYNFVRMPYQYASGKATGFVLAQNTNGIRLARDNVFQDMPSLDPLPDSSMALAFGQVVANYLSTERQAGTIDLATVLDDGGNPISAHHVRMGDMLALSYPDGAALRISAVEGATRKMRLTFDPRMALLDHLLALRQRTFLRRGAISF